MRITLLTVAALLLAVSCSFGAAEKQLQQQQQQQQLQQISSAGHALTSLQSGAVAPLNKDTLEEIKKGLDAVQKFVDIFNSKIFEGTPVGMVAEIVSKSLSFILSFMNLFGGGQSESPEMQLMRKEFAEVNAKLDGISLQLNDVKNLIEWSTTRSIYAQFELHINTASKYFEVYVKSSTAERDTRKRQFVDYFKYKRAAAFKLYQAIVDTDYVIANNLAAAVTHYTKNHRRQVTSFLLGMTRLILRGAQLEVAFERLTSSEASAAIIERDWESRMKKLTYRMKSTEDKVKSAYATQLKSDASAIIVQQRHLSNKDFSGFMYRFLADKFDWRYWIALIFKADSSYAVSHCGGEFFTKVAGNRNVAIASADPKSTRFTKSFGDQILARTHSRNLNTNSPIRWRDEINAQIGNTFCYSAAIRAVVCWGCDVWYTVRGDRISYRKITSGKHTVNSFLFG